MKTVAFLLITIVTITAAIQISNSGNDTPNNLPPASNASYTSSPANCGQVEFDVFNLNTAGNASHDLFQYVSSAMAVKASTSYQQRRIHSHYRALSPMAASSLRSFSHRYKDRLQAPVEYMVRSMRPSIPFLSYSIMTTLMPLHKPTRSPVTTSHLPVRRSPLSSTSV